MNYTTNKKKLKSWHVVNYQEQLFWLGIGYKFRQTHAMERSRLWDFLSGKCAFVQRLNWIHISSTRWKEVIRSYSRLFSARWMDTCSLRLDKRSQNRLTAFSASTASVPSYSRWNGFVFPPQTYGKCYVCVGYMANTWINTNFYILFYV